MERSDLTALMFVAVMGVDLPGPIAVFGLALVVLAAVLAAQGPVRRGRFRAWLWLYRVLVLGAGLLWVAFYYEPPLEERLVGVWALGALIGWALVLAARRLWARSHG